MHEVDRLAPLDNPDNMSKELLRRALSMRRRQHITAGGTVEDGHTDAILSSRTTKSRLVEIGLKYGWIKTHAQKLEESVPQLSFQNAKGNTNQWGYEKLRFDRAQKMRKEELREELRSRPDAAKLPVFVRDALARKKTPKHYMVNLGINHGLIESKREFDERISETIRETHRQNFQPDRLPDSTPSKWENTTGGAPLGKQQKRASVVHAGQKFSFLVDGSGMRVEVGDVPFAQSWAKGIERIAQWRRWSVDGSSGSDVASYTQRILIEKALEKLGDPYPEPPKPKTPKTLEERVQFVEEWIAAFELASPQQSAHITRLMANKPLAESVPMRGDGITVGPVNRHSIPVTLPGDERDLFTIGPSRHSN